MDSFMAGKSNMHTLIMPEDTDGNTSYSRIEALGLLDFHLPAALEAAEPPEARGLRRDEVRLLVSYCADDWVEHRRFGDLPALLEPGDVVVINTSATFHAALQAQRRNGMEVEVHLSTCLPGHLWVVEVRQLAGGATRPLYDAEAGERLALAAGGIVTLHTPFVPEQRDTSAARVRLWVATFAVDMPLPTFLQQYGFPIRYAYVRQAWPLHAYQTVYATEPGSAEMPSAGRAFAPEVMTQLVAKGVHVVPLVLHTGVSSLESHEPPYEEFYRVPAATATLVNAVRAAGKRIVAVGTTVVRALETVADGAGTLHPGEGWTRLVIGPERPLRVVNALLTGFHEPRASHLALLEALAGRTHLQRAYTVALEAHYLWHEFGDVHLLLA